MRIDHQLITAFEKGLDPQNLPGSVLPAIVLGYGEISTIFQIGDDEGIAYKRMPLFDSCSAAEAYLDQYRAEIKRKVDRYRRKVAKTERET